MTLRLAGLGLAFCLLASSVQAAPDPVVRMSVAVCDPNNPTNCSAPNSSGQIPAADPNNASYSKSTTMTVGTTYPANRGIAADCTGGGTVVLNMSGGGTLNWTVAAGHQNQPYSNTGVASAGGASCTFFGLN